MTQRNALVARSKMWGLNWGVLDTVGLPRPSPAARARHETASAARATGLFSTPGRTARLKVVYLLQVAAEIEHSLMLQYLYAAYSIDPAFAQGQPNGLCEMVNRWRNDIRAV